MKISIKNGQVTLKSETQAEAKRLMLTAIGAAPDKGVVMKKKPRPYHNAWKGKHRVPCTVCGKKFRNIKKHFNIKHPAEPTPSLPAPEVTTPQQ